MLRRRCLQKLAQRTLACGLRDESLDREGDSRIVNKSTLVLTAALVQVSAAMTPSKTRQSQLAVADDRKWQQRNGVENITFGN